MKNLFIPYELALIAKEKGFKGTCLTFYNTEKRIVSSDDWAFGVNYDTLPNLNWKFSCLAPLYQQIVDWFREVHNILLIVNKNSENNTWYCHIKTIKRIYSIHDKETFYTALNKAIEEAFKLI